ncbi:SdrD B-like domain-containing protein [Micromonospora sp. NPDC006766]|uniref:IPT/TIG domain-containing protein n=1 Tax=Micromonospora sp. NPDC006766 TaxID=3154778 RepID=UPI0033ECE8FA
MPRRSVWPRWFVSVSCLLLVGFVVPPGPAAAAAEPTTGDITLKVVSARTVGPAPQIQRGDRVTDYRWMITADDTGDPHDAPAHCLPARAGVASAPDFADHCRWPSIRNTPGAVPVIAQGDQETLATGKALGHLPAGRYLISVTADGYKIDGEHFTVTPGRTTAVTVGMQPYPLPLGTVRLRVFEDNAPVDGTYEVGAEHGLAGFTAHLSDVMGEVTVDYYGNPLCTEYEHTAPDATHPAGKVVFEDGAPVIAEESTGCRSDANGDIVIPNLGPNRYAATVVAPSGQNWVQTTTLEGGHDWDVWVQENDTGYDTEQSLGGELVPYVDFGFVSPKALTGTATGAITGTVVQIYTYIGGQGGVTVPETGVAGGKIAGPVPRPWVALSDLGDGDQMIYLDRGAADGSFRIPHVPDGDYQLTLWDGPQEMLLDSFNVTVSGGKTVNVGTKPLAGWFTEITGTVFVDTNGNGRQDPGEKGVPRFPLTIRERDNSFMDQATNSVITDSNGKYSIKEVYPLTKWLVLEAFHTRYKTTGITYQAPNDPTPTTLLGEAVDVDVLPIIGLSGRVDWGVQPYRGTENGGIAGTVTYDTTRNELDPAYAITEPYQPGIPGLQVHLHAVVRDENGDPVRDEDGSLKKGPELNDAYTSETWAPGRGCTARMFDGRPLTDQLALPEFGTEADQMCVEAPMMGFQAAPTDNDPTNFGQTVNGNYGFTDSKLNLIPPGDPANPGPDHDLPLYAPLPDGETQPLVPDDYLVSVELGENPVGGGPMYLPTREEDVNVFDGDGYLPQENFPPSPDQATEQPAPPDPQPNPGEPPSQGNGITSSCAGALHEVHVTNPAFLDGGGSPFEGQLRPLCDTRLVEVRAGQTSAPDFSLFTPVPLPTHFWGLVINDLGLSHDKRSVNYGEAEGIPNIPVGLYDWAGRLVETVDTDFNGMYEAIVPSTSTYNCPLPAGPCPNMYRFVGNDPGQPGHLNANYNPRYRTIGTNFQAWPGLYTVTDTAPTGVAAIGISPGSGQLGPVNCDPDGDNPQLFAVSRPFLRSTDTDRRVTITGTGFGARGPGSAVRFTSAGINPTVTVNSWSDQKIEVTVTGGSVGPAEVSVTAANGRQTINGLTFQILGTTTGSGLGGANNPRLFQVKPPASAVRAGETTYASVQAALEAAATAGGIGVVAVWPNTPGPDNPAGAYLETVVVHSSARLQGVGPGGRYADGTVVAGSILDGRAFRIDNPDGTAWLNLVASLPHAGPEAVPDGAVVTVLARPGQFSATNGVTIDGFRITGGNQADFPGNLNPVTGGVKTPYGAPGAVVTQGGGIYLHGAARYTRITDNVIVGNSGSYGGAIRIGTPYLNTTNDHVTIARNQIRDNGGTNLAGGIGIFAGSTAYSVDHNAICGNFSAEYGGGISHYGLSSNGQIANNRIRLNQSYDEGGGIMVAGELPSDPTRLSPGTGTVQIDANLVEANLANDDGGGVRLLQAGNVPISVTNNMLVNNISTHEGGGIALDDAPDVRFVNNTVAGNITTATAATSNGRAAPAGLSTTENSKQLQATLRPGSPTFSDPKMFNNVFWDNRAGEWTGEYVKGIGATGAPAGDTVRHWDMGSADGVGPLTPTNSVLQDTTGTALSSTNKVGVDPRFRRPFTVSVQILTSRTFPSFRQAVIVLQEVPLTAMGDWHLADAASSARALGVRSRTYGTVTVTAPTVDIDGQARSILRPDAGADELSGSSLSNWLMPIVRGIRLFQPLRRRS